MSCYTEFQGAAAPSKWNEQMRSLTKIEPNNSMSEKQSTSTILCPLSAVGDLKLWLWDILQTGPRRLLHFESTFSALCLMVPPQLEVEETDWSFYQFYVSLWARGQPYPALDPDGISPLTFITNKERLSSLVPITETSFTSLPSLFNL